MQRPSIQQGSVRSKLETVHNLTEVGKDKDENMDNNAQELDTIHVSTEK